MDRFPTLSKSTSNVVFLTVFSCAGRVRWRARFKKEELLKRRTGACACTLCMEHIRTAPRTSRVDPAWTRMRRSARRWMGGGGGFVGRIEMLSEARRSATAQGPPAPRSVSRSRRTHARCWSAVVVCVLWNDGRSRCCGCGGPAFSRPR